MSSTYNKRLTKYVQRWRKACGYSVFRSVCDGVTAKHMSRQVDGSGLVARIDNTDGWTSEIVLYGDSVQRFNDHKQAFCPPRWLCLSCPGVTMCMGHKGYLVCWCGGQITELANNWYGCAHCEDCKDKWQDRKNAAALWLVFGTVILPRELTIHIAWYLADVLPDDA